MLLFSEMMKTSKEEEGWEIGIGPGNVLAFMIPANGAQGRIYPGYMTFKATHI